jgi:hypothetical protein
VCGLGDIGAVPLVADTCRDRSHPPGCASVRKLYSGSPGTMAWMSGDGRHLPVDARSAEVRFLAGC